MVVPIRPFVPVPYDDDDEDDCGEVNGKSDWGNRSTRRKPVLASNPDWRGGKPATNRLSCGMVMKAYAGHSGETPCTSDLGTRFRSVISYTPWCGPGAVGVGKEGTPSAY
jgi:hypothetical protein